MWRVFGGAALAVTGFIEAHSHRPISESVCPGGRGECRFDTSIELHHGLTQTAYDLLRIGAWALVIFGGLLIVVGLIGYWSGQRRPLSQL
jgi:hypothetical protein